MNPGHRGDQIDPASPMKILIPGTLAHQLDAKLKKLSVRHRQVIGQVVQLKPAKEQRDHYTVAKVTPPEMTRDSHHTV